MYVARCRKDAVLARRDAAIDVVARSATQPYSLGFHIRLTGCVCVGARACACV